MPSYQDRYGRYQSQGTAGTSGPLPPGFTGNPGQAYTRQVQPNELVSNNLTGLLARNNPYITQAEQAGTRQAAARGGLNSSIAAGAARGAAIQAGLPIAQGDAQAYGNAAGQNQDALNTVLTTGMNNATSMYGADQSLAGTMYNANMNLTGQRENLAYQGEQRGLDRTFEDYMSQQGFSQQQIRDAQQQGYGMQNLAAQAGFGLLNNNQNFRYNAALQGMNNPYIMNNQEAFGGFMNWAGGDANAYMNQLFQFAFGGFGGGRP